MQWAFLEFGLLVIITTGFAVVARLFKQPIIVAYILAGIALGPFVMINPKNSELLPLFSSLGTTLLLFLIGLELDLRRVRLLGRTAIAIGLGQLALTILVGYLVSHGLLGLKPTTALFVAATLSFSSTVIVVRHLSARHDLHSLYGKLSIVILLIQDVAALFLLIFVANLQADSTQWVTTIPLLLLKVGVFVGLLFLLAQTLLKNAFSKVARSEELLFLVSLSWCLLFALIANLLGFSLEIGAFLAGLSLASLPWSTHIVGKISPLRDLFITLFFVSLGLNFQLGLSPLNWLHLIFFLIIASLLKPIITLGLVLASGHRHRVASQTALTQSQLSEFSLILIALGLSHGFLTQALSSELTLTAMISMVLSVYFMDHNHRLSLWLAPLLRPLQRQTKAALPATTELKDHWVLFGADPMGLLLLHTLREHAEPVVIVDFDPDAVAHLQSQGIHALYGDMSDPSVLSEINIQQAKHVISTIRDEHDTLFLLQHLKRLHHRATIIITAERLDQIEQFYAHGADFVIIPSLIGANFVADGLQSRLSGKLKTDRELLKSLRLQQETNFHKLSYT